MGIRPKGPLDPTWVPGGGKQEAVLRDILARFQQHETEDTLPRGPRGLFYDLRPNGLNNGMTYLKRPKDPAGWWDPSAVLRHNMSTPGGKSAAAREGRYGPTEAGVEYVTDMIALARRAVGSVWAIPEEWVADTRAPDPIMPELGSQTAAEVAEDVLDYLKYAEVVLDRQHGQDVYIEFWCEAGGLIPRIARTATNDHDVPVYSGGGMDGLKAKRQAAERAVARWEKEKRDTVFLLLGDLDLHGGLIRDVYEEDVGAWVVAAGAPLEVVEFQVLGLTWEQANAWDLLDNDDKAEAEGIPVPRLDELVKQGILDAQDPARREALPTEQAAANVRLRRLLEVGAREWLEGT